MVHPPHRLLTDERLAALAADGDERAFATLYRRHEAVLLRYCRSITGDHDDAGDALQNAMLRALGAITRNAPSGPVRPWLFRIAHNESINVLRRRRGEVRMADPEPTITALGADERTVEREALREVVDEIVRLPARQRGALVLRELEGMDYCDVASALDVTEVNARQLVFAARSGLVESQAGRALSCADVRCELAGGDLRARRRKRLRAHLRTCDACREFASADRAQRRVAGLLPKWLIGWGGLQSLLGSSGGAAGSGAGEMAAKGAATLAVVAATAAAAPTAVHHAREATRDAPSADKAAAPRPTARAAKAARVAAAPKAVVASTTAAAKPRTSARRQTVSLRSTVATRPAADRPSHRDARPHADDGDRRLAARRDPRRDDPRGAADADRPPSTDTGDRRGPDHGWRRDPVAHDDPADGQVRADRRDCPERQDQQQQPAAPPPAPADADAQPL